MYDQPALDELLDAVRMHLESHVVPAVKKDRKLYFQTLVAVNVLKIAGRELYLRETHANAHWQRLNALENTDAPPPPGEREIEAALNERNAALCERIRAGDYDTGESRAVLFDHLIASATEQLEVANPRLLLTFAAEDEDPSRDAWANRNNP